MDNNDNNEYEIHTEKKQAAGEKQSKFDTKPNASIIMWCVLLILAIIIAVELFILIGDNGDGGKDTPTQLPNLSVTETAGTGENDATAQPTDGQGESQTANPSATGSSEATSRPTSVTTNRPSATQGTPNTQPPSANNGDIKAAQILDPSAIDFSFLDGIDTGPFLDGGKLSADDPNYSSRLPVEQEAGRTFDWYPGAVERLEDGTIKKNWDRYQSTIDIVEKYNGIYRKDESKNDIVLTFDCGYEAGHTGKILDTLKEKNIKAIFFVTAEFTDNENNHALLKRMYNEGHLIGNHTANHKIMPSLSPEEFVEELNHVYKQCKAILGESFTMAYYRPPQGAANARDLALAQYLGYNTTFWSFAYSDYNLSNQPAHDVALKTMKDKLHPGAVYLLHAVSETNAEVLGDFIDYVLAEGFTITRIDQA